MSDYSFMKAGSGDDRNFTEAQKDQLQALVMLFAEKALRNAASYVEHANRKIVQMKDIKNCMKVEAMLFCKRHNTLNEAKELLEEMYAAEQEEDNNDNDIFTNEDEEWTLSNCPCPLCIIVKNLEQQWESWVPTTPLEISLKNNIDKF